jgi:hypothetical protein
MQSGQRRRDRIGVSVRISIKHVTDPVGARMPNELWPARHLS